MIKLPTIHLLFALTLVAIIGLSGPARVNAQALPERPDTRDLLPETTVALIKVRNFRELAEKMSDSSMGQMMQSESVGPLVSELYDSASRQYDRVQEQVGFSLDEIKSLPEGEITIAVIAPRRQDMAFVVMLETDEDNEVVDRMLEKGRSLIEEEIEIEESEFQIEIETIQVDGEPVYFAKHDGLLIGSSSREELNAIFTRWSGAEVPKVRPLAKNRKFATIAGRCAVSDETPPDLRFFADPIEIFKASSRGNVGMNFAVALLPTLGLDGLLGVGGNVFIDYENYESIAHGHLLMASPRNGLLNAFALKPSDYTPEPWVPENVASYVSTSWDVPQMLDSIRTISDKISEGSFDQAFLYIQSEMEARELDFDLRTDVIDVMTGRITAVRPILSGPELNSIGNVISYGLNDVEAFEETLVKIMSNEDSSRWLEEKEFQGNRYWSISEEAVSQRDQRREERQERRRKRREEAGRPPEEERVRPDLRETEPCVGIIGDNLIIADSVEAFENSIETFLGNRDSLADGEAFQDHMSSMTRLLGTQLPAAVFFADTPREFEVYLKAVDSDNLKELIASAAERDESGFVSDVKASIDEHGFPNFEDIKQYLTVSGGFVTTDDSGYHFLFFQEKPEE